MPSVSPSRASLLLLRRIYFAERGVREIHDAAEQDYAQDAAHVVIDRRLGDFAGLHFGQHFVGLEPKSAVAAHDGSRARQHGLGGGPPGISRSIPALTVGAVE